MSNPKIELYTQLLNAGKVKTLETATKVPEANRLTQLAPNKATPLWLIGHLAFAPNMMILQWILKQESILPDTYHALFAPSQAGGNPITNNHDDYPSWEEITKAYTDTMDKAIQGIATLEDETLNNAPDAQLPPAFAEMFSTVDKILTISVIHDSHHRGQISMLAGHNAG